jgi:hypothetical protein
LHRALDMNAKAAARTLVLSIGAVAVITACDGSEGIIGESWPGVAPTDEGNGPDVGRASSPHGAGVHAKTPPAATNAETPAEPSEPSKPAAPAPTMPNFFAAHPVGGTGCDSVWPLELGVTGGRVYWHLFCWAPQLTPTQNLDLLLSVPVNGGPTAVVSSSEMGTLGVTMGPHVVTQFYGGRGVPPSLAVVLAGAVSPTFLPGSDGCLHAASDAGHVYCLSGTYTSEKTLKVWDISGGGVGTAKTIATFPIDASDVISDGAKVFVVLGGTYTPVQGKGQPVHHRDGRIERIDIATGVVTVVHDQLAPIYVRAGKDALAWQDWDQQSATVPNLRSTFMLAPAGGAPMEATAVLYDPSYGYRPTALDTIANTSIIWAGAKEAKSDVDLSPTVQVRFVVDPKEMPQAIATDATHVYWTTHDGVFRRAK